MKSWSQICKYLLFFYIIFCSRAYGQPQKTVDISKIIPPSPNAASMGNFGNNSIGTFNGLPNISIPIIKTNSLGHSIDLSVSYDASGTRVAQDASWVGLGWSLNYGGGVINRTVRGGDDLYFKGYRFSENLPTDQQIAINSPNEMGDWKSKLRSGWTDGEPDIFSFNFGSNSGKFVLDKTVNGSSILQLESTDLKINYLNPGWLIIDGLGNKYYFNAQETAKDYSFTSDFETSYDAAYSDLTDQDIDRHDIITAWYLDSIVTNTSQKIRFTYTNEPSESLLAKSEQIFNLIGVYTSGACGIPPNMIHTYTASRQLLNNKVPDKILFDNGLIEFSTSPRNDVQTHGMSQVASLSSVTLKTYTGEILKRVNFYYSYFNISGGVTEKRLKLDSIKEVNGPLQSAPYRFTYYNPNSLPSKYTKATDHWGFYNHQDANTSQIPEGSILQPDYRYFAGSDRAPSEVLDDIQNGVLSSLVYPTGGKTDFLYELNEYGNLQGDDAYNTSSVLKELSVSGTQTQSSNFNLSETREVDFTFEYHDMNNPNAVNEFIADYAILYKDGQYYDTFRNHPHDAQQPFYINNVKRNLSAGSYTMYLNGINGYNTNFSANWKQRQLITQRKGGGLRISKILNTPLHGDVMIKKFRYGEINLTSGLLSLPMRYSIPININTLMPCPNQYDFQYFSGAYFCRYSNSFINGGFSNGGLIGYSKVTEMMGENGENGHIDYFFKNSPTILPARPWQPILNDPLNGKIDSIREYDQAGKLIRKTLNTYQVVNGGSPTSIRGVKIFGVPVHQDAFEVFSYDNISTWVKHASETKITYSDNAPVVSTTSFAYENPEHKRVTRLNEVSSSGRTFSKQFRYPADLRSAGSPSVYDAMADLNMQEPLIEEVQSVDNAFLRSTYTGYDFWKNGAWGNNTSSLILPKLIETKQEGSISIPRISFKQYDEHGHLLVQSAVGGTDISYKWGYNGQYPIVECKNASLNEVYFWDAEESLDYPDYAMILDNSRSHTGERSGRISNGGSSEVTAHSNTWLTIAQGSRARWFRYSGWIYSDGPSTKLILFMKRPGETAYYSYVDGVASGETGKWVYLEKDFLVPADVTQLNLRVDNYGGGSVWFDDLSIRPTEAQMTTYTYKPLVGMTSMIDGRGNTTYYEYDGFQRLRTVRDGKKNVLKQLNYHYQNQ